MEQSECGHSPRWCFGDRCMKFDPIVKEALWRSVVVFFVSIFIVAIIIGTTPLPIPAFLLFPLALTIAAVYFYGYGVVWTKGSRTIEIPRTSAFIPSG